MPRRNSAVSFRKPRYASKRRPKAAATRDSGDSHARYFDDTWV